MLPERVSWVTANSAASPRPCPEGPAENPVCPTVAILERYFPSCSYYWGGGCKLFAGTGLYVTEGVRNKNLATDEPG
jgi:hypothetical protein